MKKISKFIMGFAAIALLGACAKTVSVDEAAAHADENYSQEAAAAKFSGGKVKQVVKNSSCSGIFEGALEDGESEEDAEVVVITSTEIKSMGDSFTWKVDGKKLIAEYKGNVEDWLEDQGLTLDDGAEFSGSVSLSETWNEYGLAESGSSKIDISVKFSVSGVTFEGAMKADMSVSYTWTAAE